MTASPTTCWREIDQLLADLARKDREWLARQRSRPSGTPASALRSVAISGPAAFAALGRLSRDRNPEAWICSAIFALREAKAEFIRTDLNDPDSYGSAIFGQVEGELSQLFSRWTGRNPQSRFDADQLRLEVMECFAGRQAYWWECLDSPYINFPAPADAAQAAFRDLTKADRLPAPLSTETGPEYLMRLRAHFQALTGSMDNLLATVAAMALEDVDRVIRPLLEVVAKPRSSLLVADAKSANDPNIKFTQFTEDDCAWSPWRHRLLRVGIMLTLGVVAAWIAVTALRY